MKRKGYIGRKRNFFLYENMRYYDIKRENFKMEINGNRATATYVSVLDARIHGSRNVWRLNITVLLEKRDGAWIWVNPW